MSRCRDWCAGLSEGRRGSRLCFALLLVSYAIYLLVGAGVFSAVEYPYEHRLREQLQALRREFLRDNACVSDARLEELLARALEASNYGVSVLGNSSEPNWDFISSLFFTSTVLTTTGYGHSVPLSDGGKAFCVIYSLLGIPITLFFLAAMVQRIMVVVTRRPVAYLHRRWAVPRPTLAVAHAVCLASVVAVLFFVVPAAVFRAMESSWSYLESLYFCFISLTTIGLGDYVPGETHSTEANPNRQLYRLGLTVYLLVGLVCMLVVLETCCELPQMRSFRKRFYRQMSDSDTRDQEDVSIAERHHIAEHVTTEQPLDRLNFSSVSAQAASLRQQKPLTLIDIPATTSLANGNLL